MSMDYREYILEHYRHPRNYGKLEHPDAHAEDSNPLCGDQLAIDLQIEVDQGNAVRFRGHGSFIRQEAAAVVSVKTMCWTPWSLHSAPIARNAHFYHCASCTAVSHWLTWKNHRVTRKKSEN